MKKAPYLFALPFVMSFLLFFLYPMIYMFVMSFQKIEGIDSVTFIGMDNYKRVVSLVFSSLAGYGVAMYEFKGKRLLVIVICFRTYGRRSERIGGDRCGSTFSYASDRASFQEAG